MKKMTDDELYWIWLSSVPDMDARRFYRLLSYCGDPRAVWDDPALAAQAGLPASVSDKVRSCACQAYLDSLFSTLDRCDARCLTLTDRDYPDALSSIPLAPPVLYLRGANCLSGDRMFSIVGTRRPSPTGMRAAREIACGLSRAGVTVVSGLAYGVDACAHKGALEGGSPTVAVLGNAIDDILPRENERLGRAILESGGAVISEYAPGSPYRRSNYPLRNRIISGLSAGTLLVEGAYDSGGMITVNRAMEQNRDVFAVPGALYIPQSEAPNRLIFDGAQPALSADDILSYYRWAEIKKRRAEKPKAPELSGDEKRVYDMLSGGEMSFGELSEALKLPAPSLSPLLSLMEFEGYIVKKPGGIFALRL